MPPPTPPHSDYFKVVIVVIAIIVIAITMTKTIITMTTITIAVMKIIAVVPIRQREILLNPRRGSRRNTWRRSIVGR